MEMTPQQQAVAASAIHDLLNLLQELYTNSKHEHRVGDIRKKLLDAGIHENVHEALAEEASYTDAESAGAPSVEEPQTPPANRSTDKKPADKKPASAV